MIAYWSIFCLLSLVTILENDFTKFNKKYIYYLLFIILVFFSGLRDFVGGDWAEYLKYYNSFDVRELGFQLDNKILYFFINNDFGYFIINLVCNKLSLSIYSVNLISAFIFCYGLFKYSKVFNRQFLAILSAFPYLYVVVSMGYTRQSIAIGLTLLALEKLHINRNNLFIFFIIIALFFHKSAIIFLFVYLAANIVTPAKLKNYFLKIIILLTILFLFIYITYDLIFAKILNYYSMQIYDSKGILFRVVLIIIGSIPTIFYFFNKKNCSLICKNFYYISFIFVLFLYFLFLFFPTSGTTMIDRFLLYYLFFSISGVVVLVDILKKYFYESFIVIALICYNFLILYVWLNFAIHSFAWLPYKNKLLEGFYI